MRFRVYRAEVRVDPAALEEAGLMHRQHEGGLGPRAGRKPVLITAYLTGTAAPVEQRNAALDSVGRAAAVALGA